MKKILATAVILLAALSLFGEGKGEGEVRANADGSTQHYNVSMGFWDSQKAIQGGKDALMIMIEERFNITIEPVNVTWSDWQEKYRIWAVSGELPDVFANDIVNTNEYDKWINQGIIRALPNDMSAYPNMEKTLKLPDVNALKRADGKFYIFPRVAKSSNDMWANDRNIIIRKDWLDKLGKSTPQSWEDFYELARAFTEDDPDGNGKNDTVGITLAHRNMLTIPFLSSNPNVVNRTWIKEEGTWIPAWASKNMETGLKQLDSLYNAGYLDKDYPLIKGTDGDEKFLQGTAGILFKQGNPGALHTLEEKWGKYNESNFHESIVLMPLWPATDGNRYHFAETTFWSSSYFRGDLKDDKMARILEYYDYMLSPEGNVLVEYGIEGQDYKKEGNNIVITRDTDDMGNYIPMDKLYPSCNTLIGRMPAWYEWKHYGLNELNFANFGEKNVRMSKDFLDWQWENGEAIPTNYNISLMSTPNKGKFNGEFFIDDLTKVIVSNGNVIEEWNKVLVEYEAKGLSKAIEEVNAKALEMGY